MIQRKKQRLFPGLSGSQLSGAGENGRLPYGLLTDSSRRGYYVNTYRGAEEAA